MRILANRVALIALLLAVLPHRAEGQIFRGYVRSSRNLAAIGQVTVTARDPSGAVLGMATSDSSGAWVMRVRRPDSDIELRARRLGFEMATIVVKSTIQADTLEHEFLLTEVASLTDEVRVTAAASLNERRLSEAYRRGWRVYEPELVAQHRERSNDLSQLMRALGIVSVYPPRNANDCFRATRNNRCLTIVLDGQVLGPVAIVVPNDVYFLAILGASEARVQFGDRAEWGAIAIYTRSRYDRTTRRP